MHVTPTHATVTENLNLEIPPAPGAVKVDGAVGDWDLSGGIFACGDVEGAANSFAVWFAAMYDRDRLYLLARWVDQTPMNNPGSSKGDYGFKGDCLQVRIVTAPDVTAPAVARAGGNDNDAPKARTTHLTCWRDRDGLDVVHVAWGRRLNEGTLENAKDKGAEQAFAAWPDGKGYTQEIAIPWALLTRPGMRMKAGDRLMLTIEPNFTIPAGGRLSIKDIFKPGVPIDRVFTFQGNRCWGYAILAAKGKVAPRPVRLADGREFPVRFGKGLPVIDWTGLTTSRMPKGFKPIRFSLPEDAYISLNLFASDGTVARQLLTCHRLSRGSHEVLWDGLTTMSIRRPGQVLPAGEYRWEGFYHTGIGLRLRGWAGNSGPAPWRGWGADHGNPVTCAADGRQVYVGWSGGEGDKPLLACDPDGEIRWKNIRGGIAGATLVASDGETVYAFNHIGQYAVKAVYRLDAKTGQYNEWAARRSTDLTMAQLWDGEKDVPDSPSGLAAAGGKVFVSFSDRNAVVVVDARTGKVDKRLPVNKPSDLEADSAERVFTVSGGTEVVVVDVKTGAVAAVVRPVLKGEDWVSALAVDKSGSLYVGIRGDRHHVRIYGPGGKLVRRIGREAGRALIGPWTPDGMLNVSGLAVDAKGQLWVAEDDGSPRRVSVWDTQTGRLRRELFGASSYGATGAAINPADPHLMVGQGCEWRIDPKTGRATCLGTITRGGMSASRFGFGADGRLYLAVTSGFLHGAKPVRIYERLGEARYKLRTILRRPEDKSKGLRVWSDENGDEREQPAEARTFDVDLGGWIQGWYMPMTPDLSFYGTRYRIAVTGFTPCRAPRYDLSRAARLPGPKDSRGGMGAQQGHGSVDGRFMLYNAHYGLDHSTMDCYDLAAGRLMWTYPSNYTGVHGSHRACPAEVGMLRGAYDIVGAAKLPAPIGNVWVVPTNKGEWHVLTERGFYLTRLFEGDPMKNVYPARPAPGAVLDTCPPGAGEEAFGGSITQTTDGRLSVQVGHISYWNAEVVGLETIRPLPGGKVVLTADDAQKAQAFRARHLQAAVGTRRLAARKATPTFTGDFRKDFASAEIAAYQKGKATACSTAAAWDGKNLYVAWEVRDPTPWVNGADAPEFMYARGDTVDLQLGTDGRAPKDRKDAALGDLRVSVGPFQGRPTVVVYRRRAAKKRPKVFRSGVVKHYEMESVIVLTDARVEVKVDPEKKRHVVEAALPWAALGVKPAAGTTLRADFGVTHGNQAGNDTALRTHWSNQHTGLVSDEVFELKMVPANWGELLLKP